MPQQNDFLQYRIQQRLTSILKCYFYSLTIEIVSLFIHLLFYRQSLRILNRNSLKKMIQTQMRPELVEQMKNIVDRFNISSQTYYHAVLLFNVIQLKKKQDAQPQYITIPIKRRQYCWSSDSDQQQEKDCEQINEPVTQYIQVHHSQMPQRDKLQLTVCLFLVHKLYQPYPLCLSYVLKHLEIDEIYEEYIISLEKEFLIKLAYKIQNMLPSNQALFACQLWDQFTQNISETCLDIKFDINTLLNNSKKQVKTAHQIQSKRQPELIDIKNKKCLDALCQNIQILVHNKGIYDLYVTNSEGECHDDFPSMKKIGLAIIYVTILQLTNMVFNKKYKLEEKPQKNSFGGNTNYIDYVFNDFLEAHYGFDLKQLKQEVNVVTVILEGITELSEKDPKEFYHIKISSVKSLDKLSENLANFFLRPKQKIPFADYQQLSKSKCKYHRKKLKNMSISSTKTDQQIIECLQKIYSINKCYSHEDRNQQGGKDKMLESTLHRSNISENADSCVQSFHSQTQFNRTKKSSEEQLNQKQIQIQHKIKIHHKNSSKDHNNSIDKSEKAYTIKGKGHKHRKSLAKSDMKSTAHSNNIQINQLEVYKVSQFAPV